MNEEKVNGRGYFFAVESLEEPANTFVVVVTPQDSFEDEKFLHEIPEEILDLLEENDFFMITENHFEYGGQEEILSKDEIEKKMLDLGFSQNEDFDKYILETSPDSIDRSFSDLDMNSSSFEEEIYDPFSKESEDEEEDEEVN